MKLLIIFLLFSLNSYADLVGLAPYKGADDLVVIEVEEHFADCIVSITDNSAYAKYNVVFTDNVSFADLKVFVVDSDESWKAEQSTCPVSN